MVVGAKALGNAAANSAGEHLHAPVLQTWLSLSMIIDDRSTRCVSAPPTSMAYFSTRRKPERVQLVIAPQSVCVL